MRRPRPGRSPRVAARGATARLRSQIDLYLASTGVGLLRHAHHVAWLAGQLCDALEVTPSMRQRIVSGAYSHDIGKALLPVDLLEKPGPLTVEERALLTRHAVRGSNLLRQIASAHRSRLSTEIETALLHHERWDGSGYPRGLAGRQIPLASRIVAIVDVYDALVSARPYKPAWPHDSAVAFIGESSGSHFDPRCAAAFLEFASRLPHDWMATVRTARRKSREHVKASAVRRRRGPLSVPASPRHAQQRRARSYPRSRS